MTIVSGPGQKAAGQLVGAVGHLGDDAVEHLHAVDVHDEGVILGAALCLKYFFHRCAVAGVGGDAVDRLGGQGDQLALLQELWRPVPRFPACTGKTCVFIYASSFCAALFQLFFPVGQNQRVEHAVQVAVQHALQVAQR